MEYFDTNNIQTNVILHDVSLVYIAALMNRWQGMTAIWMPIGIKAQQIAMCTLWKSQEEKLQYE